MFVTKKRLYTELCRIVDALIIQGNAITDIRETHLDDVMEINDQLDKLRDNIKFKRQVLDATLAEFERRITALEAKKTVKKTTIKKTKRK